MLARFVKAPAGDGVQKMRIKVHAVISMRALFPIVESKVR